jgi:hypothetical protein
MRKLIHVNHHVIRANRKTGASDPPITVKTYKGNTYASAVEILGPSKLVYQPDRPLACGAHLWIETTAPVVVDGGEVR